MSTFLPRVRTSPRKSSPSKAARMPRLAVQSLEDRALMTVWLQDGDIHIWQTSGNDVAEVRMLNGIYRVEENGISTNFLPSQVTGGDVYYQGADGNDRFTNRTNLRTIAEGGVGDDSLTAGNGPGQHYLHGGMGNDTLRGGTGNDTLDGYHGNDLLFGGTGNDILYGSFGNDTLHAEQGSDLLYGEDGDDVLDCGDGHDGANGGPGDDQLAGRGGNDRLDGSDGNDGIGGGTGSDTVLGSSGDDHITGEAGDDEVYGESGSDVVWGGAGSDVVNGGDDDDEVDGGAGNDEVEAGFGNDTVRGGLGNDSVSGYFGDDRVDGGSGDDTLYGGAGMDTLTGAAGNDRLYGEEDWDDLNGGAGDDYLDGGLWANDDALRGRSGRDVFVYDPASDWHNNRDKPLDRTPDDQFVYPGLAEAVDQAFAGVENHVNVAGHGFVLKPINLQRTDEGLTVEGYFRHDIVGMDDKVYFSISVRKGYAPVATITKIEYNGLGDESGEFAIGLKWSVRIGAATTAALGSVAFAPAIVAGYGWAERNLARILKGLKIVQRWLIGNWEPSAGAVVNALAERLAYEL